MEWFKGSLSYGYYATIKNMLLKNNNMEKSFNNNM